MSYKNRPRSAILILLAMPSGKNDFSIESPKSQQLQTGQTPEGLSQQDWDSIQQQMGAGKYKACEQHGGGHASANIANAWHLNIRGCLVCSV